METSHHHQGGVSKLTVISMASLKACFLFCFVLFCFVLYVYQMLLCDRISIEPSEQLCSAEKTMSTTGVRYYHRAHAFLKISSLFI